MDLNTNFLAHVGWGIVNGNGQAITLQIASALNGAKHTHYADVVLNEEMLLSMVAKGAIDGLLGVSPAIDFTPRGTNASLDAPCDPVEVFRKFMQKNTVHISKLNFRATSQNTLPTSLIVLTPNVATGQMDRQVLNVTADTTMYQQQNNIVTMNNVDLFISRDSVIRFAGAFNENSQIVLNLDVTIDRYISVERSLYENCRLLNTMSGQVIKAVDDLNAANAEATPNMVTTQAANKVNDMTVSVLGPYAGVNRKGINSKGNR